MRDLISHALRFGLVGVANTALGLGITTALDLGLQVNPQIANAVGYGAGMILSYFLNRFFVFGGTESARSTVPKYLAALAIAFAVNQLVLLVAGRVLGPAPEMRLLAQVVAMASYTVVNFALCRMWVFRAQSA